MDVRHGWIAATILAALSPAFLAAQGHRYDVIHDIPLDLRPSWMDAAGSHSLLARHLGLYSNELLDRRESQVRMLQTRADWLDRQSRMRRIVNETLGDWPDRTPLNARILGEIPQDGYRIEKLVFESSPHFYVTAAMYVPNDVSEPRPGILYLPGHYENGFRFQDAQQVIVNLVQKGFPVLAVDPLDQAERVQHIDPADGEPFELPGPFDVHMYPAMPPLLAGISPARHFIWDYMRALDYLSGRPEVDPARLGVCGNSGGGNMTSFLAATDDRVAAAVSSSWVTSHRRRISGRGGAQDAEQDIFHSFEHGIEHTDWLLLHAPKPMLVLSKLNDFFPIQGTRETIAEVRRIYELFGAEDRFAVSEDFGGHGYTRKNREALYAFFQKHLRYPGSAEDVDYPPIKLAGPAPAVRTWASGRAKSEVDQALAVAPSGQVNSSFEDAETVFSVTARESRPLLEALRRSRQDPSQHLPRVREQAAWYSGYHTPLIEQDDLQLRGAYAGDGFHLEKHLVIGAKHNTFSFLLWLPDAEGPHPAVIYADPQGKKVSEANERDFERLAQKGYVVAVIEPLGIGETSPDTGTWAPAKFGSYFQSAFARRTHVGIWADNIVRLVYHLQDRWPVIPGRIACVGRDALGPAALHAAAFEPDIRAVLLADAPVSYESIVQNGYYSWEPFGFVPGALRGYDLQDLMAAAELEKVTLLNPLDHRKRSVDAAWVERYLGFAQEAFADRPGDFEVLPPKASLLRAIEGLFRQGRGQSR